MLTAGDIVEKHIKIKDFVFSAECIYDLTPHGRGIGTR